MSHRDRETPPDPWRPAKPRPTAQPARRPVDAPDTLDELPVAPGAVRPAIRRTGADRARIEEAARSRTPESGGIPATQGPRLPNVVIDSIPPPSESTRSDAALGRLIKALLRRYALPLLGPLLGAVGIGSAFLKPSADPGKQDATAAEQAVLKREVDVARDQLDALLKKDARRDRYIRCLEDQLREVGEQVLPAPDRMGSAKPPRPFVEQCSALRP